MLLLWFRVFVAFVSSIPFPSDQLWFSIETVCETFSLNHPIRSWHWQILVTTNLIRCLQHFVLCRKLHVKTLSMTQALRHIDPTNEPWRRCDDVSHDLRSSSFSHLQLLAFCSIMLFASPPLAPPPKHYASHGSPPVASQTNTFTVKPNLVLNFHFVWLRRLSRRSIVFSWIETKSLLKQTLVTFHGKVFFSTPVSFLPSTNDPLGLVRKDSKRPEWCFYYFHLNFPNNFSSHRRHKVVDSWDYIFFLKV